MALIKCSECGADVSEKASICPKCGCPVEVSIGTQKDKIKIRIKKVIIMVVVIVIIALIGFGIYKIINRPDSSGYYNGLKWGMTYEQVKQQLGDEALGNDERQAVSVNSEDYEGKTGIDVLSIYECSDDSLSEITLFISNGDDSSYTDESLLNEYIEYLDQLYGEHEEDSFLYLWNTEKSKIELSYLIDGLLILTYEDITNN